MQTKKGFLFDRRRDVMHQRFPFIALHAGALCACLLGLAPVGSAQGLTSSDLSKLRSVGGVALSPDGRHLAYTVAMRDEPGRSEEHTSELQSLTNLVCRLLLEKKKNRYRDHQRVT